MTEAMKNIDRIISNMSSDCRIIYIKSENRHIIERVIDQSVAFQHKIKKNSKITKPINAGWYKALCQNQLCVNFLDIFQLNGLNTKLNLESSTQTPVVLFLSDFQIYRQEYYGPILKSFLDCKELEHSYLLISSTQLQIPDGFSGEIELISDSYICQKDITLRLIEHVRAEEKKRGKTFFTDCQLEEYARDFMGLTEAQVDKALMQMEGKLCTGLRENKHLDKIIEEKKKEVAKDPTVKFISYSKKESVAGLGHYSRWLEERKDDFHDPVSAQKEGTPAPKGVLLCGIPGTGKTAMAKETARRLDIPLIQFDISRIQNRDFGASEERLRRYLDRISAFGSCVMLMDEIEKVFAVNESTHEVKRAMLSLLLDWMQTRTANVFTFITANDISSLPPELLRDGRISGRFFAFMPSRDDLCEILQLKLKSLIDSGKMEPEFRYLLNAPLKPGNPFAKMFDQIAEEAKKDHRLLFMTGANIESLMETTNRSMRKNENIRSLYSVENYIKQMSKCALSSDFVPQGQSNMDDIVNMWIAAQKRQYQDVSDHTLLPFSKFIDGKFEEIKHDSIYDQYLTEVLQDKIEKIYQDDADRKEAIRRMNKDSK